MKIAELTEKIGNREVFIWGTSAFGLSVYHRLTSFGVQVSGFVDSEVRNKKLYGLTVLTDSELFIKKNIIILLCSKSYSKILLNKCVENNINNNSIIDWNTLSKCTYYIETNNKCNLQCCTCSTEGLYNDILHTMSNKVFSRMIEKILKEDEMTTYVYLYGGNEPLLSPDIHEKIAICKENNLCVGFSTNLTVNYNYESLIKAKPDWIRISISGWGENYEAMHRKGRFSIVLKHMRELSALRSLFSPETSIELIFHKYTHNHDDIPRVKQLCRELKFEFRAIHANIVGLESVLNILEGRPIPIAMQKSLPKIYPSVEDIAKKAYNDRELECMFENFIKIHSDGTVAKCQCWQGSKLNDVNYLNTPIDKILRSIKGSTLCKLCKPRGLHRYYLQVFDAAAK